jgi:hypothetical protein
MNTLEILAMRKEVKAWRDGWLARIDEDLADGVQHLKRQLHAEVDTLGFLQAIRPKRYVADTLQPLFVEWCKKKEAALLSAAEQDLRFRFDRVIPPSDARTKMDIDVTKESLLDLAGTAMSGVAAAAVIPSIITYSTATVSAGGILGLLGVTTTAVLTRSIMFGLVVLMILVLITFIRFSKIVGNARIRLRNRIDKQIDEKIRYSRTKQSLAMTLSERIELTASQLLEELDHAS